jgi:ribonuclease Z
MHGDHYFGLIGLISTMHLFHRKQKLKIFSPPELEHIINLQLEASETDLCFELEFIPLNHDGEKIIAKEDQFYVSAFPLDHGIKCYGFLIKENPKQWRIDKAKLPEDMLIQEIIQLKQGRDIISRDGKIKYKLEEYTLPPRHSRSYAYCSDTKYNERIIPWIQGVDLLYHEATFAGDMEERADLTLHSTAAQAAAIAKKAEVKKLILGHYSTRYKDLTPLVDEAREVFPESFLSKEGEAITLTE